MDPYPPVPKGNWVGDESRSHAQLSRMHRVYLYLYSPTPPSTTKENKGKLNIGLISPTAPGVAGEYPLPLLDTVMSAWLMVTQTNRTTSPSQERPHVMAALRDQRGVLLAAEHSCEVTEPPRLSSPSQQGCRTRATFTNESRKYSDLFLWGRFISMWIKSQWICHLDKTC